jgi:hypothetical protein
MSANLSQFIGVSYTVLLRVHFLQGETNAWLAIKTSRNACKFQGPDDRKKQHRFTAVHVLRVRQPSKSSCFGGEVCAFGATIGRDAVTDGYVSSVCPDWFVMRFF